jgi:2-polyprenyl-3-methyl-5-hydroxy-6-metoxy-1,4-benzoquinol methylase
MENVTEKIKCSLCDSLDVKFYCSKHGYKLYKCLNSRLLFVSPTPSSENIYDRSYFSGAEGGFGYVDYDTDKEPMTPVFEKYIDLILKYGISKGKLLDVGAATGFFMNLASKKFEVYGVEVSDFAAQKGRNNGLNILTGSLETSNYLDNSFDVITMFDVLEHLPNPKTALLEANRILRKGGLLIINTPDSESLWANIMGSRWHLIVPPEHINYFSPKTLSTYTKKIGLKVVFNDKIGKSFTFQYIFNMLHKWQGLKIWGILEKFFSKKGLSKLYIPVNLHDNFFMILKK